MKPIVFCAAVPQEIKPLCRRLGITPPNQRRQIIEGTARDGCNVCVAVSGVGRERMKELLERIPKGTVSCWVSIGFAGGLAPNLMTGDCIIGRTVLTDGGERITSHHNMTPDTNDLLFCSKQAVCKREEKATLHRDAGAVAVDMESASVARFAEQRGEPFAWIRVISDAANDEIPPAVMNCMNREGFPSASYAVKSILHNPSLVLPFVRLGVQSGRCAKNLAEAVLPWLMLYHSPSA